MVEHIHKDIDAYFSHLSRNLKNHNFFVVANLMKVFMESQELSFKHEFIQEVANFKSFVKEYIRNDLAKLIGLKTCMSSSSTWMTKDGHSCTTKNQRLICIGCHIINQMFVFGRHMQIICK